MNLISVEKAVKAYGPRPLLDGVSLGVPAGDRIGVVGRSGAGKSTLLSLLAGTAEPDSGRIARGAGLRIGYLPQRDGLSGTLRQLLSRPAYGGPVPGAAEPAGAVAPPPSPVAEPTWAADARARAVVYGLVAGINFDAELRGLTSGERRRAALAATLAADRDVLILDEPTSHLDLEAIDWLGSHLSGLRCAVIMVSNDRWLLDTVCDCTWEVGDGHVHSYDGGYSAYVLARAERGGDADVAERSRRSLLRKELAWLRRGPRARTARPKFRVDAADALIAGEPPARDSAELTRLATASLGKTVIEAKDVTVRAGQRVLLDRVTWRIGPGERVGVLGVAGSGKTSLLRLLDGSAGGGVTAGGRVVRGQTVRIGHLRQERDGLDPARRVLETVQEAGPAVRIGNRELTASQLLERLGFRGDGQSAPVSELSGGERRRLQMVRLLMAGPNVLLLDEPTDDLDIETLTEMEDLLDGWPGSLVVVSRDRYFLERVTDGVVALLGDGRLSFLGGGVDEYLERARSTHRAPAPRRAPANQAVPAAVSEQAAGGELQRLERQIDRLSNREAELSARMAVQSPDYEKLTALGAELRAVRKEKAALEDRWLIVVNDLDG